jgi:hypothetical protein
MNARPRLHWMLWLPLLMAPAHAFKIDPWRYDAPTLSPRGVERQLEALVNNPRQLVLGPVSWVSQVPAAMGQLKEPVHENLTDLSIRCATAPARIEGGLIVECAGRPALALGAADLPAADLALIRASRWSDAPPMRAGSFINPSRLVCGEVRVPENAACWAMLMSANGATSSLAVSAAAEDSESVRRLANLLRRSHYGDMQFLHAMASPGETLTRTRERMLLWAEFTYRVATGEFGTDALIGSLSLPINGDILRGLGARTVHQIFETRASATPDMIRTIALGALLHMVQDSYSPAHTARLMTAGANAAPFGAISVFHDFGCQVPSKHAELDRADSSPWLAAALRPVLDPVTVGAQLIAWARSGVAWEPQVRGYVQDLFALSPAAATSGTTVTTVATSATTGRCGDGRAP